MRPNLDTLRGEIQEYLELRGVVVFHSHPRAGPEGLPAGAVYWDAKRRPDYREFVDAASAAGARLMTLYAREFSSDLIENALDQMNEAQMEREERRALELRLREMRAYEGFICQIELSFEHGQRVYLFDVRTDWFDDLNDLLEQIEDAFQDDEEDESPLGGYYSNN